MSSRVGLRYLVQQTSRQAQFQTRSQIRQTVQRRAQTTAANPAVETPAQPQSLFQRLWTSEVGIKTVHFWAPVMKWGVVLSGAADFLRPAEKLSLSQNAALVATGTIWTRWCFVIRPKNMLLAAVNACLAVVGAIQCSRILAYQSSQTGSVEAAAKEMGRDLKGDATSLEHKVEKEIKART
ncbi:hypothetical protein LTR64_005928 [Lithohypha guttulata]|uniref:Mitochondrial pyruvate carrier n=1 Tax=Lithohypha guttulata TaxID=1690604 RepID=A0AAN7Y8M7_9EURO|nr:hypothetical protein LTR51_002275 [Lithohypha guttulata]KAK5090000.1 hypothetical protein LTR05_000169 [Lithohypha guttulata]